MSPSKNKRRDQLPKCKADIMRFLVGADPQLVTELLPALPPSFYIVGAPRCGTTALSKALSNHPAVSFAKPKETHYLTDDHSALDNQQVQREYLEHFHPALSMDTQAIGDGSVSYLYNPDAIRQALRLDPRAKFIVSVRNPVNMMRSYHQRLLFSLDEDVEDFDTAWGLQAERAAGHQIPERCREPRTLQYGEVGRLGENIARLFDTAGRERCMVVVFDDFIQDPRATYLKMLEFIGLEDDGQSKFKRTRANAGFKSGWLQQYSMNPPPWVYQLIRISNSKSISRLKGIRKRIKKFNRVPAKHTPMSEATQAMLRDYFRADIAKLSALLERDLSHWLEPPNEPPDERAGKQV